MYNCSHKGGGNYMYDDTWILIDSNEITEHIIDVIEDQKSYLSDEKWVFIDSSDLTEHSMDIENIIENKCYTYLSDEKFNFILEYYQDEILQSFSQYPSNTKEEPIQQINMVDEFGNGILQYLGPSLSKLKILYNHYPQLDLDNSNPKLIDLAVSTGQNATIEFLIDHGASYTHIDDDGNNLLHHLVIDHLPKDPSRDLSKTMGYLMSLGISLDAMNNDNKTPLDLLKVKDQELWFLMTAAFDNNL
jgi:hypothetical protein